MLAERKSLRVLWAVMLAAVYALGVPPAHAQDADQPNLQVGVMTVSDAGPAPGGWFTRSTRVSNTGAATSPETMLRVYRSTDSTITTSDTQLVTTQIGPLLGSGNAMNAVAYSLTAPSTAGTYCYWACVDAVTDESDTTDNCSVPMTVVVGTGQLQSRKVPISASTGTSTKSVTASSNPVTEGSNAMFTLTRTGFLSDALMVNVSETESGSMVKGTPSATVTLDADSATAELGVETDDDEVDESASVITAELAAGSGYSKNTGAPSATVTAGSGYLVGKAQAPSEWTCTTTTRWLRRRSRGVGGERRRRTRLGRIRCASRAPVTLGRRGSRCLPGRIRTARTMGSRPSGPRRQCSMTNWFRARPCRRAATPAISHRSVTPSIATS